MGLNEPFTMTMQFDLKDFEGGSYADLTYQVIHRMIKVGPGLLRPLYKSLVSVISNTAPYVKSLSKDSSECIFSLIKTFSNPEILQKREETSRILSNLFEAVNYILLYHDEGNEEFLVALIKYREVLKINDLQLTEEVPAKVDGQEKKTKEVKEVEDNNEQAEVVEKILRNSSLEDKPEDSTVQVEVEVKEGENEKLPEKVEVPEEAVKTKKKIKENKDATEETVKEEVKNDSKDKTEKEPENESTEASIEEPKKSPKKEEIKDTQEDGSMVDVPLDDIKHQQKEENEKEETNGAQEKFVFMTPEWEVEWKKNLNLANLKQAIQYTDDKARSFLAKNPSPDNNIDADKFVEFLKKSSLKGLLPNPVKILVTTYNGNNSIDTWAISYIWGQIFMRQQEVPMFNIEAIKMFKVNFVNSE